MSIITALNTTWHHLYYLFLLFVFYYKQICETIQNILENLKLHSSYRKMANIPDNLTGKTVVITGVDSGIGRATLEEIASRGAKVLFTCLYERTEKSLASELAQKYPQIKESNLIPIRLDLASAKSIEACAQKINSLTSCIDVLINNAGVMCHNDKDVLAPNLDKVEFHFQINYLGHFYLTFLLLEKLKRANNARIVNITSTSFLIGYPLFGQPRLHFHGPFGGDTFKAYGRSKLAILLSTQILARKLKEVSGNKVKVYAVHPGMVKSSIADHIGLMITLKKRFDKPTDWITQTPLIGAQTTLNCAFSTDTQVKDFGSGAYYE